MRIGLLHPGAMGSSVGQALVASGHDVVWASAQRSSHTRARGAGLRDLQTLQALLSTADAVICVCPPHAAEMQAAEVAQAGFQGLYVDANAIAPDTAARIAQTIGPGYVDGGIIGPPARQTGTTRLYLSGPRASEAQNWFSAGALDVIVLNGTQTAASALKMAYAAYTKGMSALLLAVNALAEATGVRQDLLQEWALSQPSLPGDSERVARATANKAWRFTGEMQEIAATFAAADLPADFHVAAAALYDRMAALKERPGADLEEVLQTLLQRS